MNIATGTLIKKNSDTKINNISIVIFSWSNIHPHFRLRENSITKRSPRFSRIDDFKIKVPQKLEGKRVSAVQVGESDSTSTNTLLSSIWATFLPKHCQRPPPKIRSSMLSASLISCGEPSIHRSGRNVSASSPHIFLFRKMPNPQYPIEQPPGINLPFIMSPSGGTSSFVICQLKVLHCIQEDFTPRREEAAYLPWGQRVGARCVALL